MPEEQRGGRSPLREQVREELRSRINEGVIKPGERIYEHLVASELGVSRNPVREAIRMLESEGLVVVEPRRGVLVRRFDPRDVEDLFDVREAMEVLAARLAARRRGAEDLDRLRQLTEAGRLALVRGDLAEVDRTNSDFHEDLIRIADNRRLHDVWMPLQGQLHWLFRQNSEPERVWHEHRDILDAVQDGDDELAAALALRHVRSARRMVLAMLAQPRERPGAGPRP
ncbi:GntR family transcriptional regulator [Streptomyces marincola]|uniref:GntR family transcriptional regulator n=1 Tax=Streptomyces marincola TaxID=2878388 RepID=UPI001CF0DCD5|nr:GntR family transcriptional regulator [Streptomyces marincola]UCM88177.1 GntR family transcriptional regulator [Streptomyces marincola]